jgi:hypothetical protein
MQDEMAALRVTLISNYSYFSLKFIQMSETSACF